MLNQNTINPSFHLYNSGDELIVCIHGYGQSPRIFKMLSKILPQISLLTITLPFHETNSITYTIEQLNNDLLSFLDSQNYNKIHLFGYSIGARLAIYFYQHSPTLFDDIYLVAPDGVDKNPLFPILTHTYIAPLFEFVMRKQKVIHKFVYYVAKMKLISKNQFRFALKSLGSSQESVKVAKTWIALRKTRYNNNKLLTLLTSNKTKLFILVGKKDKIITPKKMYKLSRHLPKHHFLLFDANHYQVLIKAFQWLRNKKTS